MCLSDLKDFFSIGFLPSPALLLTLKKIPCTEAALATALGVLQDLNTRFLSMQDGSESGNGEEELPPSSSLA